MVNPLRTLATPIPVNHHEMACETHFYRNLMRYRPAIEAVAHATFGSSSVAFSRHLPRYFPLMDRPAVLRWLSADETCSAQCLRRRTVTTQLCFLLSILLLDMKYDATDRFM